MEIEIGKKIYELRKKKGLTQEQLANTIGVSTPAVSKWETGNAYPDITLLARLARYLDTNVDNLLNYSKDISDEEVIAINTEYEKIFAKDGLLKAINYLVPFLQEYPNNIYLKYRGAGMIQQYAEYSENETDKANLYEKAIGLAKEVANSSNSKLVNPARALEAAIYMCLEKYDLAESTLSLIENNIVDPDTMLPSIYILQDKLDKAENIEQKNLYKNIVNAINSLYGLITVSRKRNNSEQALYFLGIIKNLIEQFHFEEMLMLNYYMMKTMVYADMKDIETTLEAMESYLSYIHTYDWDNFDISKNEFFSTMQTFHIWKSMQMIREGLMQNLLEDPRYDFVRDTHKYKRIIKTNESLL